MTTEFLEDPESILSLLKASDADDIHILNDYITDNGKGRIANTKEVEEQLRGCRLGSTYSRDDLKLIDKEIRLYGGNSLINLIRQDGVNYREIVVDVAEHLKVNFNKSDTIEAIELGILSKLFASALEQMSGVEREEILKDLTGTTGVGPGAVAALLAAGKLGGFKTFKLAVVVANAISKAILGRGLPFVAGPILTRTISVALGPIGWVITGLWTVADLASPAYRVTVPCVVQIAYMRQKAKRALEQQSKKTCPQCESLSEPDAKFCASCGKEL